MSTGKDSMRTYAEGLDFLETADSVFIKQNIELFES